MEVHSRKAHREWKNSMQRNWDLRIKNRPTKEEFEDARKMDEQGPGNMGEGTARRKDQKEHVAT